MTNRPPKKLSENHLREWSSWCLPGLNRPRSTDGLISRWLRTVLQPGGRQKVAHGASRGVRRNGLRQPGGRYSGRTVALARRVSPSGLKQGHAHPSHGSRRGLPSVALRAEDQTIQKPLTCSWTRSKLRSAGRYGRTCSRRGFTLVELIATCILLGVVFSVSIPLLTVVARERRSAEQRQFALQHAANLLERATTRDWAELPVGNQELTAAPGDVQTLLPGLERQVEVRELPESPRSKQVTVSIRWTSRSGQPVAPIRLSAWVYPNGEEAQ